MRKPFKPGQDVEVQTITPSQLHNVRSEVPWVPAVYLTKEHNRPGWHDVQITLAASGRKVVKTVPGRRIRHPKEPG